MRMTPERWQKVKVDVGQAFEQELAERPAFGDAAGWRRDGFPDGTARHRPRQLALDLYCTEGRGYLLGPEKGIIGR
jgi:hypothetical protein